MKKKSFISALVTFFLFFTVLAFFSCDSDNYSYNNNDNTVKEGGTICLYNLSYGGTYEYRFYPNTSYSFIHPRTEKNITFYVDGTYQLEYRYSTEAYPNTLPWNTISVYLSGGRTVEVNIP